MVHPHRFKESPTIGLQFFFSLVELWRNTALKKFGVELRAGVELGGTLQSAGRARACDAAPRGNPLLGTGNRHPKA